MTSWHTFFFCALQSSKQQQRSFHSFFLQQSHPWLSWNCAWCVIWCNFLSHHHDNWLVLLFLCFFFGATKMSMCLCLNLGHLCDTDYYLAKGKPTVIWQQSSPMSITRFPLYFPVSRGSLSIWAKPENEDVFNIEDVLILLAHRGLHGLCFIVEVIRICRFIQQWKKGRKCFSQK